MHTNLSIAEYRVLACCLLLCEHDEFFEIISIFVDSIGMNDRSFSAREFCQHVSKQLEETNANIVAQLRFLLLKAIVQSKNTVAGDAFGCRLLAQKVIALPISSSPELITEVALQLQILAGKVISYGTGEKKVPASVEPFPF